MKKLFIPLVFAGFAVFVTGRGFAEDHPGVPRATPHYLRPNGVPVPTEIISGTITVQRNGVLVDVRDVTYRFAPEFEQNTGWLERVSLGTYFLRASNVPSDQSYKLTVSAAYDDSIRGGDGVVQRQGHTYTGAIEIEIPYTRRGEFDFGVRFLDLR